jgi:hypothetical protein
MFRSAYLSLALAANSMAGVTLQDDQLELPFGPQAITVPVQGRTVPISARGLLAVRLNADGAIINVRSHVSASSLQPVIAELIRSAGNANDDCGNKVNLHTITATPSGTGLLVRVSGHAEHWECGYITHPIITGWNPLPQFKMVTERIFQTKIVEQNGTVAIQLDPVVADGGRSVQMVPSLREITVDGFLGALLRTAIIGDVVRSSIQNLIMNAVNINTLRASLPADLSKFSPELKEITFEDIGGGQLGVIVSFQAIIPKALLQPALGDLLASAAK